MEESILTSTKKVLGIGEDYTVFDEDILMHINSAFATLHQLGLGPDEGFTVTNKDATWTSFLDGDPRLNSVKTYVYLKVRTVFDPPGTSFLLQAIDQQIKELEWRLNVAREAQDYEDPLADEEDEET